MVSSPSAPEPWWPSLLWAVSELGLAPSEVAPAEPLELLPCYRVELEPVSQALTRLEKKRQV